jgi:hypothetical protein
LIAQRVAYRRQLAALVLLSPIPRHGLADSAWALAKKSPISVLKLGTVTLEPRLARLVDAPLGIYSSRIGKEARMAVTRRLQAESPLALGQSLFPRVPHRKPPPCPLKFWGAEGDHIIPASEVRRAARDMGAEARIFPGMSHNMQCEPDWRDVADDILKWIGSLALEERHQSRKTRSPRSGQPAKGCGTQFRLHRQRLHGRFLPSPNVRFLPANGAPADTSWWQSRSAWPYRARADTTIAAASCCDGQPVAGHYSRSSRPNGRGRREKTSSCSAFQRW